MKKLLITLILVGFSLQSYSQTLIQTFTDRCTGATQVFQIAMTGTTTVVFYDRAKTFTAADVSSGVFQAWLEETYAWWAALNPCSAAQAESTTAQQTASQTASAATSAATSAASTPPPDTSSTNTTSNAPPSTDSTTSSSGGDTTSSSQSTDSSSSSSSESSQSETSDSSGGGETTEESGGGETTESESESTEDTSSEESSESEEEVKEEESKEESSEESKEEEEKKEEKKEKKKNLAPPILASNLASMQMLDGTWSTAASFGLSQSSLTGVDTYSANLMLWSNFKQFSLGVSKSTIHFWKEYESMAWTISQTGKRTPAINFHTGKRYVDRQNQIHHIGGVSLNYMYIFGTSVITGGINKVVLGQKDNIFKGFAGGYAATSSIIILPGTTLISPAFTLFGTRPINFKTLPRWSFAPMIATSLTPIQLIYTESKLDIVWNEHFTYIVGVSTNFNLTQRFVANLGINTINNTNPIIPTSFAITIGARFSF